MNLSYSLATLAALTSAADAYQSAPCTAANSRPSSALNMRRRSPMKRYVAPSGARSNLLRQMDELIESQLGDFVARPDTRPFLSRRAADLMTLPDLATARRPNYQYRINEDQDKFTLTVDLPGVKASDAKITIEQDNRVLRINGMRTVKEGEMSYESNFDKAFVLDRSVDVDKIQANLSEGVLTVDAPKKPKVAPKTTEIQIQQQEVPQISDTPEAPDEIKAEDAKTDGIEMKAEAKAEDEGTVDLDNIEEQPKQEKNVEVQEEEANIGLTDEFEGAGLDDPLI